MKRLGAWLGEGARMTHVDLVERAERWLYSVGCGVVLTELVTYASGIPDAIGFRSDCSILVECKTSRSDFFADRKKPHHGPDVGMGNWRFYLTPEGLIKPEELPQQWGLLYAGAKGRVQRVSGCPQDRRWWEYSRAGNVRDEMRMMYSALRRLKLRGVLDRIYEKPWEAATAA